MKKLITISIMLCSLVLTAQIGQRKAEKPQEGKIVYNAASVIRPGSPPPSQGYAANAVLVPDCTVNGVTITTSGSDASGYITPTAPVTCSPLADGFTGTSP